MRLYDNIDDIPWFQDAVRESREYLSTVPKSSLTSHLRDRAFPFYEESEPIKATLDIPNISPDVWLILTNTRPTIRQRITHFARECTSKLSKIFRRHT